jgi:hypothetical protein
MTGHYHISILFSFYPLCSILDSLEFLVGNHLFSEKKTIKHNQHLDIFLKETPQTDITGPFN